MKSTAFHFNADHFQPLSTEEALTVNGGETLIYWISYGVGVVVHTLLHSSGNQTTGQKLANYALS